jgi:hypothetical protein
MLVGTVIAYAGPTERIPSDEGWTLCDGRPLSRREFPELFSVIHTLHGAGDGVNTFNIPDFRGYFLRGVSGSGDADPDKEARQASMSGGASGNEVGTVQEFKTAMPRRPFVADTHPGHSHGDPTWNGGPGPFDLATVNRGPGGHDFGPQSAPTSVAGEHSHIISGGDVETRPKNKAVNWIIKIR